MAYNLPLIHMPLVHGVSGYSPKKTIFNRAEQLGKPIHSKFRPQETTANIFIKMTKYSTSYNTGTT